MRRHTVSDIYTTDHNRLPSVDCDTFGLTANVSGIKVWVILLQFYYKGNPNSLDEQLFSQDLAKRNPK
jgi:hypothetical protein